VITEIERIQDQLRRSFEGGAWHGPAVLELLADVNATQAAAHPIPGAHSIWELTLHIAAWERAVTRRLSGGRPEVPDAENFPRIDDASEAAWQQAIETLQSEHQELLDAISRLDELQLDDTLGVGPSSVYVTLHGVVQHNLYHAGQIAILKRSQTQCPI
jgi:uncharacterized damage-inducible protein DinB